MSGVDDAFDALNRDLDAFDSSLVQSVGGAKKVAVAVSTSSKHSMPSIPQMPASSESTDISQYTTMKDIKGLMQQLGRATGGRKRPSPHRRPPGAPGGGVGIVRPRGPMGVLGPKPVAQEAQSKIPIKAVSGGVRVKVSSSGSMPIRIGGAVDKTAERVKELEKEVQAAKEESMRSKNVMREAMKKARDALTRKNEELEKSKKHHMQELNAERRQVQLLEAQVKDLQHAAKALEEEETSLVKALEEELERTRESWEKLSKVVQMAEQLKQLTEMEHEEVVTEFKSEISTLKQQLIEAQASGGTGDPALLEGERTKLLKEEIVMLREELTTARSTMGSMREEQTKHQGDTEEAHSQASDAKLMVVKLEKDLVAMKEEKKQMESEHERQLRSLEEALVEEKLLRGEEQQEARDNEAALRELLGKAADALAAATEGMAEEDEENPDGDLPVGWVESNVPELDETEYGLRETGVQLWNRIFIYVSEVSGNALTKGNTRSLLHIFDAKKIRYTMIDTSIDIQARRTFGWVGVLCGVGDMKNWSGRSEPPQVFVDNIYMGGWPEMQELNETGRFDELFINKKGLMTYTLPELPQ